VRGWVLLKEIDQEKATKCEVRRALRDERDHHKTEASRYCLTTDCVLTTSDIMRRMNLSADPCNDFWQYSCGGWLRDNRPKLADHESWGVEDEVEAGIRQHIHHLLQDSRATDCADDDGSMMTTTCKMRLLYSRCMDTQTVDAAGAQPLIDILNQLGGWSALGLSTR